MKKREKIILENSKQEEEKWGQNYLSNIKAYYKSIIF